MELCLAFVMKNIVEMVGLQYFVGITDLMAQIKFQMTLKTKSFTMNGGMEKQLKAIKFVETM